MNEIKSLILYHLYSNGQQNQIENVEQNPALTKGSSHRHCKGVLMDGRNTWLSVYPTKKTTEGILNHLGW